MFRPPMSAADPRLPVLLRPPPVPAPAAGDFLLLDAALGIGGAPGVRIVAFAAPDGHAPDCLCCAPRSALARTLAHLVIERARGEVAPFERIVAVAASPGRAALRALLARDGLLAGRYRLG